MYLANKPADYIYRHGPDLSVELGFSARFLRDVLAFAHCFDPSDYCGTMVSYTKYLSKTLFDSCVRHLGL